MARAWEAIGETLDFVTSYSTKDLGQWPGVMVSLTGWLANHDDVIKWKHFPHNWPKKTPKLRVTGLCAGNSPVNTPHKGQWRGALVFSLICTWTNGWVNNRDADDLRRHRANYDVTLMAIIVLANLHREVASQKTKRNPTSCKFSTDNFFPQHENPGNNCDQTILRIYNQNATLFNASIYLDALIYKLEHACLSNFNLFSNTSPSTLIDVSETKDGIILYRDGEWVFAIWVQNNTLKLIRIYIHAMIVKPNSG